jgi:hypothetical protein
LQDECSDKRNVVSHEERAVSVQRELKPPFKFDIADIVKRLRRLPVAVDGKVTISLPFVEVSIKPDKDGTQSRT